MTCKMQKLSSLSPKGMNIFMFHKRGPGLVWLQLNIYISDRIRNLLLL